MRTGRPPHLPSFDYCGLHRYSLTWCTDKRTRVFVSAEAVNVVLEQVLRAASLTMMAVIAYCFMPDHLHLLVRGEHETSDCRNFIKQAKQFSGFYFSQRFDGRLWQRYGFERVLRAEDATVTAARYILGNPVRAGLVTNPREYPFVGSTVYRLVDLLDAVQTPPSSLE